MNSGETFSVGGINFSGRFVLEIRRQWQETVRESPTAIVDIRPTRRAGQSESAENEWSIYFLLENIFRADEVYSLQGIPIHISPNDREVLTGKVVDFEDYRLVVR